MATQSKFNKELNANWSEVVDILAKIGVDIKKCKQVGNLADELHDLDLVENGVYIQETGDYLHGKKYVKSWLQEFSEFNITQVTIVPVHYIEYQSDSEQAKTLSLEKLRLCQRFSAWLEDLCGQPAFV